MDMILEKNRLEQIQITNLDFSKIMKSLAIVGGSV